MSIGTKRKTLAIVAVIACFVAGAAVATYLLSGLGQDKPTLITLADTTATTQKDTDAVVASARQKLATIRKQIEDAGHAAGDTKNTAAIDAGFEYLAEHLHNDSVAQFDPLAGFTYYTVGKGKDGQSLLLIERPDTHNGLNLTIDASGDKVVDVHYWGKRH